MLLFEVRGCLIGISGYRQMLLERPIGLPVDTVNWLTKWGPVVQAWRIIEREYRENYQIDKVVNADWEELLDQFGKDLGNVQEAVDEAQDLAFSDNGEVQKLQQSLVNTVARLFEFQQLILTGDYKKHYPQL